MSKAKDFMSKFDEFRMKEAEKDADLSLKEKKLLEDYDFPEYEYFKYPQLSVNLKVSKDAMACEVCGKKTHVGFSYWGAFGDKETEEPFICPECIKEGKFAKENHMEIAFDMNKQNIKDQKNIEILQTQNPPVPTGCGFLWRDHCGDFLEYLGLVSAPAFKMLNADIIKDIEDDIKNNKDRFMVQDIVDLQAHLPKNSIVLNFGLHLFRCKHCGKYFIEIEQ